METPPGDDDDTEDSLGEDAWYASRNDVLEGGESESPTEVKYYL